MFFEIVQSLLTPWKDGREYVECETARGASVRGAGLETQLPHYLIVRALPASQQCLHSTNMRALPLQRLECPYYFERLLSILEYFVSATKHSHLLLKARCAELDILLHRWAAPVSGNESINCTCNESQQQQILEILDKVEKAVKFSQCVREGRDDVVSPWQDDNEEKLSSTLHPVKKAVSRTGLKPAVSAKSKHGCRKERGNIVNDKRWQHSNALSPGENHSNSEVDSSYLPHIQPCPVHNNSNNTCRKSKGPQYMGVAEAIDVQGIPPELVTILKTFHRYINRLRSTNIKAKAENSFLRRLSALNDVQRHSASPLSDSIHSLLRTRFCSLEEKSSPGTTLGQGGTFSSSLWNPAALEHVSVNALSVQYNDIEMWQLLQHRMEQLQLYHMECALCDELVRGCLQLFQVVSLPEASIFLKAAMALCRVSILKIPFLVKAPDH